MLTESHHLFSPKGRIGRLKYVSYICLHLGMWVMLLSLVMPWIYRAERWEAKLSSSPAILTPIFLIFSLYCIFILIILSIRRLHDLNLSGGWLLFCLIPKVPLALGLLLISTPSAPDINRFGAPPTTHQGIIEILGGLSILILLWSVGMT